MWTSVSDSQPTVWQNWNWKQVRVSPIMILRLQERLVTMETLHRHWRPPLCPAPVLMKLISELWAESVYVGDLSLHTSKTNSINTWAQRAGERSNRRPSAYTTPHDHQVLTSKILIYMQDKTAQCGLVSAPDLHIAANTQYVKTASISILLQNKRRIKRKYENTSLIEYSVTQSSWLQLQNGPTSSTATTVLDSWRVGWSSDRVFGENISFLGSFSKMTFLPVLSPRKTPFKVKAKPSQAYLKSTF